MRCHQLKHTFAELVSRERRETRSRSISLEPLLEQIHNSLKMPESPGYGIEFYRLKVKYKARIDEVYDLQDHTYY